MEKWADFLISGIWFLQSNDSKYVSHVMVHSDNGDNIGNGSKKSKDEVIALIDSGVTFSTISWNYSSAKWNKGAKVGYEKLESGKYLRSYHDQRESDNLDNLLRMNRFIS